MAKLVGRKPLAKWGGAALASKVAASVVDIEEEDSGGRW